MAIDRSPINTRVSVLIKIDGKKFGKRGEYTIKHYKIQVLFVIKLLILLNLTFEISDLRSVIIHYINLDPHFSCLNILV